MSCVSIFQPRRNATRDTLRYQGTWRVSEAASRIEEADHLLERQAANGIGTLAWAYCALGRANLMLGRIDAAGFEIPQTRRGGGQREVIGAFPRWRNDQRFGGMRRAVGEESGVVARIAIGGN